MQAPLGLGEQLGQREHDGQRDEAGGDDREQQRLVEVQLGDALLEDEPECAHRNGAHDDEPRQPGVGGAERLAVLESLDQRRRHLAQLVAEVDQDRHQRAQRTITLKLVRNGSPRSMPRKASAILRCARRRRAGTGEPDHPENDGLPESHRRFRSVVAVSATAKRCPLTRPLPRWESRVLFRRGPATANPPGASYVPSYHDRYCSCSG